MAPNEVRDQNSGDGTTRVSPIGWRREVREGRQPLRQQGRLAELGGRRDERQLALDPHVHADPAWDARSGRARPSEQLGAGPLLQALRLGVDVGVSPVGVERVEGIGHALEGARESRVGPPRVSASAPTGDAVTGSVVTTGLERIGWDLLVGAFATATANGRNGCPDYRLPRGLAFLPPKGHLSPPVPCTRADRRASTKHGAAKGLVRMT